MRKKEVTIQNIANHFGLIWLNGDRSAMKKQITEIACNRPGLELACFFGYPRSKRLILIGNKETAYIKQMTLEELNLAFDFLFVEQCPGCIICGNNDCNPEVLKIAKKKNFPIFKSTRRTNDMMVDLMNYLSDELAPQTSIHGTLLDIYSTGVIITGESGIGKSETALELVKKGHHLVSDDRVDISFTRNRLIGRAPELLHNMIEVRGIGIIDCSKMFGINAIADQMEIDLVIKLVKMNSVEDLERLGTTASTFDILGQKVTMITIPVSGARSICDIIEVAVTNYKLKKTGYDSTYEFEERLNELLRRGR
ncbi:MAG: HPr(Ser) kinase/phosphatase [Erysipelotrichaceae bacterium]|nr:HPr(Ser) kinase/phosphatase [Erysipelotrichaceae bacterium]